jgi:hypothetical protein
VSVTLEDFTTQALVLFSGEPAVTAHIQSRIRGMAQQELSSARTTAAIALAAAGDLLGRLPPQALSGPPPVNAVPMLTEAGRLAAEAEAIAAVDPTVATLKLRRAAAIAGQFERRVWENGVKAEGSMVSSPLLASDTALGEEWQFVAARGATVPGPELLRGGGMERIEDLAGGGWRHFAHAASDIQTSVEIGRANPATGQGCLRLAAKASSDEETPVVIETPPVWVTTPPLQSPAGKLVEISAQVMVPKPIGGSVDGLFVFDSLGGPALGERVAATKVWRRLVLHRIVPAEAAGEPITVTFALTGLGVALIDDVSIRVIDRGVPGGVVAVPVSASPRGDGVRGFPSPDELLAAPPPVPAPPSDTTPPSAAAAPAGAGPAWPGMNLEWPKLIPFGQSADEPGPDGGTIDPFKRARGPTPPPAATGP